MKAKEKVWTPQKMAATKKATKKMAVEKSAKKTVKPVKKAVAKKTTTVARRKKPTAVPALRLTSKDLLKTYLAERKNILDFVNSQLKAGTHYGYTAFDKSTGKPLGRPGLKKPGAEQICIHLQLDPVFIPDVDTWQMLGAPDGKLIYQCFLMTRTDKREALRQLKLLGKENELSIYRMLAVAEGRGAYTVAQTYKGDQRTNTVVKMAQKAAQVDTVLRVEGLSEIFDQDVFDELGNPVDFGNSKKYAAPEERDITPEKTEPVKSAKQKAPPPENTASPEEQPAKSEIETLRDDMERMLENAKPNAKKTFRQKGQEAIAANDLKKMKALNKAVGSMEKYWKKEGA